MSRAVAILFALATWLAVPPPVGAQSPAAPRSAHARASDEGSAILRLANLRLYVPPGAVAPGAVVGLGAGGVPTPDGALARSSAVVTAADGLRAPVALLIAPTAADQAVLTGATPALLDAADGERLACATAPPWIACPVPRPGAYILDRTSDPPSTDPLLREALTAAAGAEGGSHSRLRGAAIVLAVALTAGVAAWLLTGRADSPADGSKD